MQLDVNDYKILKCLKSHNCPISAEQIARELPRVDAIDLRLRQLSKGEFAQSGLGYIPDSWYIIEEMDYDGLYPKPTGMYSIAELGKKALQDYQTKTRAGRRRLWMKNAWIPILVSLAVNGIIQLLRWVLPPFLEWLSRALS